MSCDLRGKQASKAIAQYTALHEGTEPTRVECTRVSSPRGTKRWLGKITDIQYTKRVRENGRVHAPPYHHPFAPFAQPDLYADSTGKLFVRGTRYYTTDHGIEDWRAGTPRTVSGSPKRLVLLGKLEWIRYNDGQRSYDLRFDGPGQPELAHDELGKLHVLMPRGHFKPTGDVPMAKRRSRKTRRSARRNPGVGKMTTDKVMHLAISTAMTGGVAILATKGLQYIPGLDTLPRWGRAAAEIGLGLGAGVASAALGAPASVVGGLALSGVIKGGSTLADMGIEQAQALMAPAQLPSGQSNAGLPPGQTTTTQSTTTAPGGALRSLRRIG